MTKRRSQTLSRHRPASKFNKLLEAKLKAKDDEIRALNARIKQEKVQQRKKSITVDPALSEKMRLLREERKSIYDGLRLAVWR